MKKPREPKPLPEGYIPPMPYAGICPACKVQHNGSFFTYRDEGPTRNERRFGYFCLACERAPFWMLGKK